MYQRFFGLTQAPFSIAPDPRHLYLSQRHREALAHLLYGLQGGGGFVLLSGEIGTGKTTLCRSFLSQVPAGTHVAYVFNPALSALELLRTICDEFGVALAPGADAGSVKDHLDPLNRFLLAAHAAGEQAVLVIDEAQNLAPAVLEQLRLLTNLETHERKLLQIILIGQPELRDMLARPELEQLAQRVIARYHLGPLDAAETADYVAHRLAVAGRERAMPFDAAALRRLHRHSGGVPRRINLLADRALLGAYAAGRERIHAALVDRAADEVAGRTPGSRLPVRWWLGGAAALGLGLLAWPLLPWPPSAEAPVPQAASAVAAPASAASATSAASTPVAAPVAASVAATGVAAPGWRWVDDWPVTDEASAWRELALAWGAVLPPAAPPCGPQGASAAGLACYRARLPLSLVQQLDRPGLVLLRLPGGGPAAASGPAPASRLVATLLLGLDEQQAVIGVGERRRRLSRAELAAVWTGDFATLWRPPAGYQGPVGAGQSGPAVDQLAAGLARAEGRQPPAGSVTVDAALRSRIEAFQRAQGLPAQGAAGPQTFMQLHRAIGLDEPHLLRPQAAAPAAGDR